MVFIKHLLCGSNSAVAENVKVEPVWDPVEPATKYMDTTTLVQECDAYLPLDKLSLIDLTGDLDTINETESEYNSDYDSESDVESGDKSVYDEVEVESDDEYEFYEVEVEDDCYEYDEEEVIEEEEIDESKGHTYDFAKLFGKRLVSKARRRQVRTDDAMKDSAIVALYFADATLHQAETELLSVFSAGYEEKSFSVVFCSAPKRRRRTTNAGFKAMPEHWLALPARSSMVKHALIKTLGIDAIEPCVIVFDASTGSMLSRSALQEITDLDPASSDYDAAAQHTFQSWILNSGMQQHVVGEKEIECRRDSIRRCAFEKAGVNVQYS